MPIFAPVVRPGFGGLGDGVLDIELVGDALLVVALADADVVTPIRPAGTPFSPRKVMLLVVL